MGVHKEVHVLVATPLGRGGKGGIDRIMDNLQAELRRNPPKGVVVRMGVTRGKGHIVRSPIYLLMFVMRAISLRLIGRCDVLHINLSSRGSTLRKAIVGRIAYLFKLPYVVHLHGSGYDGFYDSAGRRMRRLTERLFSDASGVIVLGQCWSEFVNKVLGVPLDRIRFLPNAVPKPSRECYRRGNDTVRIIFLGALGPRKGVPQLLQALKRLPGDLEWNAVLGGDGDVEGARALVERYELCERVTIPGWLNQEETEALLCESDILVLPSFAENLPMSVIEGMAYGLAVVATPVGATPDIIESGENGLLVTPGDVDALAESIQRLIEDRLMREKLGEEARRFHRKHLEISVYSERLIKIWRHVATGNGSVEGNGK